MTCPRCEMLEGQRDLYARERDAAIAELDALKRESSPIAIQKELERVRADLDRERTARLQIERSLVELEKHVRRIQGARRALRDAIELLLIRSPAERPYVAGFLQFDKEAGVDDRYLNH